jgi:hypothetical protein
MERVFDRKKKNASPHRWLGLRPVDFVRAAERRAASMSRAIRETAGEHSVNMHAPLTRIRRTRSVTP